MIGAILGGIGLFLLGMELLSEGLQTAAGDALRGVLRRYTRSRASGLLLGAGVTAVVQSSSATTLAVVGFVGAGLLPFEQAIAVMFGANVGTTATAWIVASVGLKVSMSAFALPLVGTGAVVKLFARGKRAALGSALAGFGLVFVGIDVLQGGMSSMAQSIDPRAYALDGFGGRIVLVLTGIVMTVVMQSSSAAMATTLTALHAGALTIDQAAALAVGQNVGTTVTAVIAAASGGAPARRVAAAHCVFNVGTGVIAVLMLPLFVEIVDRWIGHGDASLALSGFHTAFNVLGVAIFLPFTKQLAAFLVRRIPQRGAALVERLSRAGVSVPGVAVEAARATTRDVARLVVSLAAQLLRGDVDEHDADTRRDEARAALEATREHLRSVHSDPAAPEIHHQHVAVLHAIDHIQRLVEALAESTNARAAKVAPSVQAVALDLAPSLDAAAAWLASDAPQSRPGLEDASRRVADRRSTERASALVRTAKGELSPADAESSLEALRWVDRIAYHAWRATHHLEHADKSVLPPTEPPGTQREPPRADEVFDAR